MIRFRFLLPAAALLLAVATYGQAQTATDLNCTGCVNPKDIAKGAVKSARLGDLAVTTEKIKDGAVAKDKIRDGSVTTVKLKKNAVQTGKIADGAVTTDKIADGAITPEKLATPIVPASGASIDGTQSLFIDPDPGNIVASITLSVPADGLLILLASGYADFNNIDGDCSCSLTTGEAIDGTNEVFFEGGSGPDRRTAWSAHRGVPVTAGEVTYNLVCREGADDNVELNDVKMSAMFVQNDLLVDVPAGTPSVPDGYRPSVDTESR